MKLLHTSDWHLGKVLKGTSRLEEQAAVLGSLVRLTAGERVDVVLVAGDVYESAAPPPEAQALAWRTLLALADTGAQVVVVAGNHDNAAQFEAVRPLAASAGITVLGRPRRPGDGGVLDLRAADGSHLRLAALPFVSQRFVVRAADLMDQDGAQHAGSYAERCRMVLRHLCAGFGPETVNVVVAHAMVRGGRLGGGEREAQTIEDYWIDATAFPPTAQYVALGHLHRTQQLPGPAPLWYSGSPIQVDFGEQDDDKHVLLVEVHPGRPARVEPVRLDGVRRLRTVDGTVAELRRLADEVRAVLPNALEIRLAAPVDGPFGARPTRQGRTPHELFSSYLQERRIEDPRVERLFAELLDDQVRDGP